MLRRASSPVPWLGALLALYLLAPLAAFLVRLGSGVSSEPGLGTALLTSLFTASVATIVIALFGVPLAYVLAHWHGALSRVALALVALPLALPPLMSGLLLLYVLGPYTTVGRAFDGQLTDTRAGIVLAQTFVAAPFLIVTARAGFAAVDESLEDVARTLGHGQFARFRKVALRAALPTVGAGLLLAWLRSFGEFGATLILAYHPYSLPVFTLVQFGSTGLPATMLPVAVALGAALGVLLVSGVRPRRATVRAPARASDPAYAPPATIARPRTGAGALPRAGEGAPATLDFCVRRSLGAFSLELAHRSSSPWLALLGPSGAGKTLTLRLLAGLIASEGGHVRCGSLALDTLACEARGIGYVPQEPALVPRLDVWRQVRFGAHAREDLAALWLERLGIAGLERRLPEELSSGQRRRVSLARALATAPRLLLLDEPFTGLDAPVRDRLRRELRRLQREAGLSTVIVTHDPEEAAMLADELIVIDEGRALQAGSSEDVFRAPRSPHIAALLGVPNAHRGRVEGARILSDGLGLRAHTDGLPAGGEVIWCVRPEHIAVDPQGEYEGVLLDEIDLGHARELSVCIAGALELSVRSPEQARLRPGAPVRLRIPPEHVRAWPARG